MKTAFARQTKISNVVGRSDYISNPKRQEEIVYHDNENLKNSWQEYATFENQNQKSKVANNQARELIIPLPHDLANDTNKLKTVVDDYAKKTIGNNRDFEYAVHWNKDHTNLHAHIIFSERERIITRDPKTYKRDMWYDKDTNKMAKAKSPNAELRYKKGEVQKEKDGSIKYESDPFTTKDKYFKTLDFNEIIKKNHAEIMNKHGYQFRLFDKEHEIAQQHVGNKTPESLKEKIQSHNKEIKEINNYMDEQNMSKDDRKKMITAYKEKIKELVTKIKSIFKLKQSSQDDDKEFEQELKKAQKILEREKVRTR